MANGQRSQSGEDWAGTKAGPDMAVWKEPRDSVQLTKLLDEATALDQPTMLRIPKATTSPGMEALARIDGIDILHRSSARSLDVLIVAVGALAEQALKAARELEEFGIGSTVADPRWVLPVNPALPALAARHRLVVSVEDNLRHGPPTRSAPPAPTAPTTTPG
ncbi:transketolase C-terminal domain-containing protein, partial [Streptomyces spectabilis]|uniref:transketolase C-terminal domain-containing protein n=1 Tax=Streptomyces spectabilis TaxID=68270 RepID=UPI0033DC751D